jgi:hypothetical protein
MQQQKLITGLKRLFVICLVVTGLTLSASAQAEAKGQCHKINTTQTSVLDPSNFTTVGEFKSGLLKGTSTFAGEQDAVTPIPGPSVLTVSYTGILTITTDKGILTTRGVGVFETGPFGIGAQFDRVIGGTGFFAGATGFLYYTFTGDASGAAFTSVVSGEICVQ